MLSCMGYMKAASFALILVLIFAALYLFTLRFLPGSLDTTSFLERLQRELTSHRSQPTGTTRKPPVAPVITSSTPTGFRGPTAQPSIKGPSGPPPNE